MPEWRKAIPESRDRLQSLLLVWSVTPLLVAPLPLLLAQSMHAQNSGLLVLKALIVSLTFGVVVWALRAATPAAAFLGALVCLLVIMETGYTSRSLLHSGLAPLMALFLLTFAATRAGARQKAVLGVEEAKRGRNAAQITANLGMAGLVVAAAFLQELSGPARLAGSSYIAVPAFMLAALCEATADTVSSELGQAFGGRPFLITTLRRVSPGTDGAISLLGTCGGMISAAIVALTGMWSMQLTLRHTLTGLAGGIGGLLFDSLLGATIERRGWLGNDLVNFLSTAFAVLIALLLLLR